MRILELHCDYFSQKPRSKALKSMPELSEEEKAGSRMENVLVVFTSVEEGDDASVAKRAAAEIEKNFKEVKAATICVHPYAHLSSNLAKPDKAQSVLHDLWTEVRKFCPDAKKSVFGYYKEFELKCKGHPLAELSKTITSEQMAKVAGSPALPGKEIAPGKKAVAKPELLQFVVPQRERNAFASELAKNTAQFLLSAALHKSFAGSAVAGTSVAEDGYFVDLETKSTFSDSDLETIGKEMASLVASRLAIELKKINIAEASKLFEGNQYKLLLLKSVPSDSKVYLARMGDYADLVNGPMLENSGKLAAFLLTKAGGAYWLDESANKQLQRVTGVAFGSLKDRDDYLAKMAEAEKRDHRKLGKELKIFMFSEDIGMGLPLWMPNGEVLRHTLMEYMRTLEERNGYKYVQTPSISKSQIFYTSGHLPHYKESMYAPIDIEGSEYYLKPMNCPFHHTICRDLVVSYRDLPLRLAEPGSCYRYELSGTMYGIIRTRNFTQNDSHIYCTPEQTGEEFAKVLRLFKEVYKTMGIGEYWYRLSLPDFDKNPEKYAAGEERKRWEWAADLIRKTMKDEGEKFEEAVGEAAFYGPKIDVQIRNVFGKDDSIATIQVDVLMPKRFNLTYVNEKGEKEHMVMIHRAILGSFERFIAFLLEQYAGNLPTWLSPVQVAVLPLTDGQAAYARKIRAELELAGLRATLDANQSKIEHKIRDAQLSKIPYMIVVGQKEQETGTISVRTRKGEVHNSVRMDRFVADIAGEIDRKERR